MVQGLVQAWKEFVELAGLFTGQAAADNVWGLLHCFERCTMASIHQSGRAKLLAAQDPASLALSRC